MERILEGKERISERPRDSFKHKIFLGIVPNLDSLQEHRLPALEVSECRYDVLPLIPISPAPLRLGGKDYTLLLVSPRLPRG